MGNYFYFLVTILSVSGNQIEKSFVDSNNLFAASLYREVLKTAEGNFLISPFSAEIVLALAQAGAKGPTAEELRTGLHLSENFETSLKTLVTSLGVEKPEYSLRTANKFYVKKGLSVKESFKKIAREDFHSDLENIDFSKRLEAAEIINKWVEQQTESTIRDVVDSAFLDERTRMVLINALYFKANWSTPFFTFTTKKANFWQGGEKVVLVDFMHEVLTNYQYYENAELGAKFLEIPFEGRNVTMTFVLPEREKIDKLENHLDKVFSSQNYSWETVDLAIPKFKIGSGVDLKKNLEQLGVKKAFTDEADFAGITDEKLRISDVLQKTFIDVNEQGVEAAAATLIRLVDYSGVDSPTKEFHADHPFIFYIKLRDLILFAGRVTLPSY